MKCMNAQDVAMMFIQTRIQKLDVITNERN
jgi:hypothetical protein